jgi:predicted kinase
MLARQKLRCQEWHTAFRFGQGWCGKTTLARQIARTTPAVLICEDEWMLRLADPIENLQQYLAAAAKIRSVIAPLCIDLLKLGTSVVFDFAGNTVNDRRWVRSIFEIATADHRLHYILADDDACKARVRQRNVSRPEGVFFGEVTDRARELDLIAVNRELAGIGDPNLSVLNAEHLDESDHIPVHLGFLQFGFALPVTGLGIGFPGQLRTVLLEREGVLLVANL